LIVDLLFNLEVVVVENKIMEETRFKRGGPVLVAPALTRRSSCLLILR
jgi:hypothetical protein